MGSKSVPMQTTFDAFFDACCAIVGERNLLLGSDDLQRYGSEWTGQYDEKPIAIARPCSAQEVSGLLKLCVAHEIAIVPQGGRTGLCGGAVPIVEQPSLIISLERMNKIRNIDITARTVTAEAGTVLEVLQEATLEQGLIFPLMFGARGSCMIGGNLSTNAGGSNVVRYGSTRQLCLGIEAVMPDGTIVNALNSLHKDNTGYDLKNLLIGAEGTLGIITAAVFKLSPQPRVRSTSFLSVSSLEVASQILNRVQDQTGGAVEAFEYVTQPVVDAICNAFPDVHAPLEGIVETGILLEVASVRPSDAEMNADGEIRLQADVMELLAEMMEDGLILDAMIVQNEQQRSDLWHMRESVLEGITAAGPAYHFDISLPLSNIPSFLKASDEAAAEFGFKALTIGHLGDGNLHYAIAANTKAEWDALPFEDMRTAVLKALKSNKGSFSAEHGIGQSKLSLMKELKDPGHLAAMRVLKKAFDPSNLMNPGKFVPLE